MEEIWKNIKNYYGLYQVSNLGKVKSIERKEKFKNFYRIRKEKILKPGKDNKGYLQVVLYKDGKMKNYYIHRLVGEAFIDNPNNLPQINHKDENPSNNNVENLEWCDNWYNSNYGTRNERIAKTQTGVYNTKKSKAVLCIEKGIIYPSTAEVQRQLGFAQQSICKCCNGKLKTVGKLHWKYVD